MKWYVYQLLRARSQPSQETFTDYQSLSKEMVTSWVIEQINKQDAETVSNLKKALVENIEKQKSPPIITMLPPWQ